MDTSNATIAIFTEHSAADAAVRTLGDAGFAMNALSVIGKGYHTEEKVTGFYNNGDRISFWGRRGAVWGGLWGLFFGGMFMTVPLVGSVVVLGYFVAVLISTIEGAVVVGGLSVIGAALYGMGIPKDSVVAYEAAIKEDNFMVVVHGSQADVARAKDILAQARPQTLDVHAGLSAADAVAAA